MNILKKRKEKELLKKKKEKRDRIREDIENLEAEIRQTETVFNAQKAKMNYLLKLAREI